MIYFIGDKDFCLYFWWKMATLGKLTEYDPEQEEWGSYVERLEFFFTANDITDAEKKKAILLSSSGSKTYKLFRGLTAPAKPGDMTFAELVKLMKNHLSPKPNPIAERFRFNTRDRQPEESVANYVMELRCLTEHCEYGTSLNDMLRDRLVCGIKHDRIQLRLLSEGAELTLERALQIAQSMESAIKQSTVIQNYQHRTEGVHKVFTQERSYKECFRCGGRHAATVVILKIKNVSSVKILDTQPASAGRKPMLTSKKEVK